MKSVEAGEKEPAAQVDALKLSDRSDEISIQEGHIASEEFLKSKKGILPRLLYYEALLDRKMGVEPHGPKRITPENKKPPNQWIMFFMWGSTGAWTLGNLVTGFIGLEFGLNLGQTLAIVLFGCLLGSAAAVSIFCPCLLHY